MTDGGDWGSLVKKKALFDRDEDVGYSKELLARPVGGMRENEVHRGDLAYCERINGSKVCTWEDGRGLTLVHCRKYRSDDPRLESIGGLGLGCRIRSHIQFIKVRDKRPVEVYIHWFGAEPREKGWGKETYEELEKYLRAKCVRRINLHALSPAEPFWESRGFEDERRNLPWVRHYPSLRAFRKDIEPLKNCSPPVVRRKRERQEHQYPRRDTRKRKLAGVPYGITSWRWDEEQPRRPRP